MNLKNSSSSKLGLYLALYLIPNLLLAGNFGKFTYEIQGTSITITEYPQKAVGEVNIPPQIAGKPVTRIGDYAFSKCSDVTSVNIPSSVKRIGEGAFFLCTKLTKVNIPSSVTIIERDAFSRCTELTRVDIPSSVATIGTRVFSGCESLTTIYVDVDNPSYSSMDGVLFNKAKTALHTYPAGKAGHYRVPSQVKSIGDYAFMDCVLLNSVTLPYGMTTIGTAAFQGCERLNYVLIPETVTAIGEDAFDGCGTWIGGVSAASGFGYAAKSPVSENNAGAATVTVGKVSASVNINNSVAVPVGKAEPAPASVNNSVEIPVVKAREKPDLNTSVGAATAEDRRGTIW